MLGYVAVDPRAVFTVFVQKSGAEAFPLIAARASIRTRAKCGSFQTWCVDVKKFLCAKCDSIIRRHMAQ